MTSRQTDGPQPERDPVADELEQLRALLDNDPPPASEPAPTARHSAHGKFERPQQKTKRRSVGRTLLTVLGCIVLALGLVAGGLALWLHYHHERGMKQLQVDVEQVEIELPAEETRVITPDNGKTVSYQGKRYRLNEHLSTVLFLGIDRNSVDEVDVVGTGGQADVILLMAIDTETGKATILNIPRDTYAELLIYSGDGDRVGYENYQICLAYAYGDGRETSCENMTQAVRHLLYGMPISKYFTLDMDGVLAANEAVGGVTLKSLEDLQMPDGSFVQTGDEITLHGQNCERYIRERGDEMDANAPRMARQLQYVNAFAATLTQQAKQDFGLVSRLYEQLTPYLVSDLDLSDVIFLAQTYLEHGGMEIEFLSFDGHYDWLENAKGGRNAVLYPDEDSLFAAILAVYYTEITEE